MDVTTPNNTSIGEDIPLREVSAENLEVVCYHGIYQDLRSMVRLAIRSSGTVGEHAAS